MAALLVRLQNCMTREKQAHLASGGLYGDDPVALLIWSQPLHHTAQHHIQRRPCLELYQFLLALVQVQQRSYSQQVRVSTLS